MRRILLGLALATMMSVLTLWWVSQGFAAQGDIRKTPGNNKVGNSTAAHDCGTNTQDVLFKADLIKTENHGQCVSFFAQGGQLPGIPKGE